MEIITQVLDYCGFGLDPSAPEIVKFCLFYLILLSVALLNVINICVYLISIYIVTHEKFLRLIPAKYTIIHKILNFYVNIRVSLIILEFILLIITIGILLVLSYSIVSFYIEIK